MQTFSFILNRKTWTCFCFFLERGMCLVYLIISCYFLLLYAFRLYSKEIILSLPSIIMHQILSIILFYYGAFAT